MFGLGTLVNTISVVVGGIIGLLFKNGLKNRYQETIMQGIGLAVLFVGISGAMTGMLKISKSIIESTGSLILVLSLCFGALIGEFINIEKRIEDWCSGSASGMCIRCDECGDPGIGQQLWYGYRCWMGSLWKA